MIKIVTLIALVTFSFSASAHVKDSTPVKVDTVYILSKGEMDFVQTVIRQNSISYNGKLLTFDEVLNVLQMLSNKMSLLPRKEPIKK